jgi:hypothetical protein
MESGHWIVSARIPWVTLEKAPSRDEETAKWAMFSYGFFGVLRTTGCKATGLRKNRRKEEAIGPYAKN